MKFLFVAPRFHTNQFMVTKSLIDKGHEVSFFVYYRGKTEDYSYVVPYVMKKSFLTKWLGKVMEKQYGPVKAEGINRKYFIPHFFNLFQKVKEVHPDIVIVRDTTLTALYINLFCKVLGIKYVVLYNQIPLYSKKTSSIKKKIKIIIKKLCFPRVRITTVCMENPTKYIHQKDQYYIKKHDYFVPFVEEARDADRPYCQNGIVSILGVGKYRDTKNHFLLVNALMQLKDKGGFRAMIVGQAYNQDEIDYYDRLNRYIREKGLDDVITLKKNVDYAEMKGLYAQYDVFALTTKREFASIAVLEAMANGMVTISTDNNGTASYIEEGKCGFLFKTMDVEDLVSKIDIVLSNKERIKSMGKAACENIRENYSCNNYYEALGEVLKKEFNLDLSKQSIGVKDGLG